MAYGHFSRSPGGTFKYPNIIMGLFRSLTSLFRRERTVVQLAKWLDVPETELREWLGSAPMWARGYEYTRFTIPKRRGGARTISAPTEKLKALQRRILYRLLNPLPMHPSATGFVRGRSIVDNAQPHVGQGVVINLDLADFFPTITTERVAAMFRGLGWDADSAAILSRICTDEGRLPQGAPTSPAISNLVCRRLDERLSGLVKSFKGHYTRYADDITFSLPGLGRNKRLRQHKGKQRPDKSNRPVRSPSRSLLTTIRRIIEEEGFQIQMKKKVRVQRPHQRQTATGLVVNQAVHLPRATRRRIRAMQHRQRLGQLDAAGQKRLRGYEALLNMIEGHR
jgi:retron-type reverse transcriptase